MIDEALAYRLARFAQAVALCRPQEGNTLDETIVSVARSLTAELPVSARLPANSFTRVSRSGVPLTRSMK